MGSSGSALIGGSGPWTHEEFVQAADSRIPAMRASERASDWSVRVLSFSFCIYRAARAKFELARAVPPRRSVRETEDARPVSFLSRGLLEHGHRRASRLFCPLARGFRRARHRVPLSLHRATSTRTAKINDRSSNRSVGRKVISVFERAATRSPIFRIIYWRTRELRGRNGNLEHVLLQFSRKVMYTNYEDKKRIICKRDLESLKHLIEECTEVGKVEIRLLIGTRRF